MMTRKTHRTVIALAFAASVGLTAAVGQAGVIDNRVDDFAVYSGGSFSTARNVQIGGSLGSLGSAWIDRDVNIDGSVVALGGLGIDRDVNIEGNIDYRGSYWANAAATIGGSVTDNATPADWDAMTLTNPGLNTSSRQSLWFSRSSNESLSAGDYGSLSADRNVTLSLSAGEYNFSSLWLGRDSKLSVDTSAGDVMINVVGSWSTDRGFAVENTGSGRVLIQTGRSLSLDRDNFIEAQLTSFGSASIDRDTTIDGTLHAKGNVWLDQGVSVSGAGRVSSPVSQVPEPTTVAILGLGALALCSRPRPKRGE